MRPGPLAVRVDVHPRGDEVPGPQLRRLALRHRFDHRVEGDPVTGPQRPQILLLAVGGDDGGVSGAVQQSGQLVVRPRAVGVAGEAAHRPGLEHGRRSDGVRPLVGGVGVTHGLAPVPDHRLVDRVLAHTGGRGRPALIGLELLVCEPYGAHRRPLRIPSRIVATISRWTSLTPPPKVLICAARFIRSSSPSPKAPGEPPRIRAASPTTSWHIR